MMIFYLEWWKYVFSHHVNPFITHMQWAPSGTNLAQITFIPLAGVAAIPLTTTLGPVATYNLLMLLCPSLAAWAAFCLCRYLRSSFWAAALGGYVFGFSPWMLSHVLGGHPPSLMMFPVPLIVLLTLRRLNEEISARAFAIKLAILILVLFLCWPEAVATATMFGAIAIVIAWLTAPQLRLPLQGLVLPTVCAFVASVLSLSPYLYYFFAFGLMAFPGGLSTFLSVHPSNFLIPTTVNLFGTLSITRKLIRGGQIYETGAYMALPMLLVVVSFARARWQEWGARLLVTLLGIVSIASLGPMLQVSGNLTIPMPWLVLSHLPLMDKALPARFSVYVFLILGLILCLWLNDDSSRKATRIIGASAVVLFTLPNLSAAYWVAQIDTPPFFRNRLYTHYLAPDDNVLILPYAMKGNSNIWQATTGLYFRMPGGYVNPPPFIPVKFQRYFPLVYDFINLTDFPLSSEMLKAFLVENQVNAIIVADEEPHLWVNDSNPGPLFPKLSNFNADEKETIRSLFGTIGVAPIQVGGVSFYRVPLEKLDACKSADLLQLEARIAAIQLDTLITAGEKYLSSGRRLSELNPVEAQRLGLLPPRWISGLGIFNARSPVQNGLVLTAMNNSVVVGVISSQEAIQRLAGEYRPDTKRFEVSPLGRIATFIESTRWILLVEYDRAQLARAAQSARQRASISTAHGGSFGP